MVKQKKVYKWYLILSIIYSSISILAGIIFFIPKLLLPLVLILIPIGIVWFILNIVMLFVFIIKKIETIALWLPCLYIFDYIFSIVMGIIFGIIAAIKDIESTAMMQNPILIILSLISPIIILIVAIKLILRK
jgi:hypothetical protein